MDSFEAEGVWFDVESSRADPSGFWVVAWDEALSDWLPIEACVRAISAAQDVARQRFPGRGGVVRVACAPRD